MNKTIEPDKKTRSKLRFDEADFDTAGWMLGKIRVLLPNGKDPNLESWANTIRLMREQDNHTAAEIRAVFGWANADSFWQSNVLSPDKLRKQYDRLALQSQTRRNNGKADAKPVEYRG